MCWLCAAGRTGATTSFLVRKESGSEHLSTDVGLVGETKKMRYYSCLLVQVAVTPKVSIFFIGVETGSQVGIKNKQKIER